MHFEGSVPIKASRDKVWAFVIDPDPGPPLRLADSRLENAHVILELAADESRRSLVRWGDSPAWVGPAPASAAVRLASDADGSGSHVLLLVEKRDANTGWVQHEAVRVAKAVRDVDVYIEQPCLTYEECLAVRRKTDHPFVLDENVDSLDMLLRAKADLAMDVVNLKISKLGGLTRTRQARDLCVSMGIAMTLEDSWGGDITTAAIAHLAHSTPEEFRFTGTEMRTRGGRTA